jgi:hypothetical protein
MDARTTVGATAGRPAKYAALATSADGVLKWD